MRYGSVCSGIEAATVAWHGLGWAAAWYSEIEPFPCAVLAHYYPTVPNLGDMTLLPERIRSGEVEAPDILCGGTPCQAFSVAGQRQSLADARGNLTLTFVEIADAIDDVRRAAGHKPTIIVWENVPGVLNTADNAFGCFLAGVAGESVPLEPPGGRWTDAGAVYGPARTIAWRVLDAQYFGVAQRRRRVFVVASDRDGFDPAQVLLEWEGVRRDFAPSREAGEGTAGGAAPSFGIRSANTKANGWGIQRELTHTLDTASPQIVAQAFGGGQNCAETDVSTALSAHPGESRLDFQTETFVAHTLRGEGFDASEDGTGRGTPPVPVHVPEIAGTMKACKDSGGWSNSADHAAAGVCHAIGANANATAAVAFDTYNQAVNAHTSQTIKSPQGAVQESVGTVLQAMQVRRLTPTECERLQGFPDGYTAIPWRGKPASECPDGPRYKALGNSWAVPVVRWIGQRIANALEAAP